MFTRAIFIVIMVLGGGASVFASNPKLSQQNRHVFCGREGHETSAAYGEAVNRELTWRIAAGARTPKEALAQMREEYCLATGSTK